MELSMDVNQQRPPWAGPRFDLDDGDLPRRSLWQVVRRFFGLAVMIACLILTVHESFRWAEQQAQKRNAVAGRPVAKPAVAAPEPAPVPPSENIVLGDAAPDPQAWADEQRLQAEAFHKEARKRHQQMLNDMQARLDDMHRRQEAFRARARQRHEELMRRNVIGDDGVANPRIR
jgi:hypothetical protein